MTGSLKKIGESGNCGLGYVNNRHFARHVVYAYSLIIVYGSAELNEHCYFSFTDHLLVYHIQF